MARRKLSPKEKYCASRPERPQPDPSSQTLKAAEKAWKLGFILRQAQDEAECFQ
jgi:hypothetical protein